MKFEEASGNSTSAVDFRSLIVISGGRLDFRSPVVQFSYNGLVDLGDNLNNNYFILMLLVPIYRWI